MGDSVNPHSSNLINAYCYLKSTVSLRKKKFPAASTVVSVNAHWIGNGFFYLPLRTQLLRNILYFTLLNMLMLIGNMLYTY